MHDLPRLARAEHLPDLSPHISRCTRAAPGAPCCCHPTLSLERAPVHHIGAPRLRLPLDGIDGCHAAVSYGWPWQACVDGFKFGAQTGWATALAGVMLRDPLVRQAIRTCDVLVPMPLHPLRLVERGYVLLSAQASRRCTDREENWIVIRLLCAMTGCCALATPRRKAGFHWHNACVTYVKHLLLPPINHPSFMENALCWLMMS